MRGTRALDLGRVLDRLQRQRGIGSAGDALGAAERARKPIARGMGIEAHALAGRAQRFQPVGERGRLADLGEGLELRPYCRRQLVGGEEQLRLAARRNDGEGERHRRVRDVGAADVEHPGDAVAEREDDGILLVGLQALLDVGDLVLRRAASELLRMQRDRVGRRGRARPPPHAVDEVAGRGDELDAVRLQRRFAGARSRRWCAGADRSRRSAPRGQVLGEPFADVARVPRWRLRSAPARPRRAPAPYSGRRRTASPFLGDDGEAGRAGEARQPFEARRRMPARIRPGARRRAARGRRRAWRRPSGAAAP